MSTVVGLFESRDQAQRTVENLTSAGFQREDISIVMRDRQDAAMMAEETGAGGSAAAGAVGGGLLGGLAGLLLGIGALAIPGIGPIIAAGPLVAALTGGAIGAATGGLIGALVDAGVPEDEARVYQQGIERGGILVSVKAPDGRENEVRSIMQHNGMQDATYHQDLMKDEKYEYDINRSTDMAKKDADKTTGGALAGGTAGAVIGTAVAGPVGTAIGAAIGGTMGATGGAAWDDAENDTYFRSEWERAPYRNNYTYEQAQPAYRYGFESYREGSDWNKSRTELERSWKGQGRFADYEPMIRSGYERRGQSMTNLQGRTTNVEGQTVIPVVEEELQIGKRAVESGRMRVDVDVTETPVQEQVKLREEHVRVERRPVNREVAAGDTTMFKEGEFDVTEMSEEAVVSKRARVVEEIVIGKETTERTETVRDSVRRTDVDVQQMTGNVTTQGADIFRQDYDKRFTRSGYTYEQFTPAYTYGQSLAADQRFASRDWRDVEVDARKTWEQTNPGTWDKFKDAVQYAWDSGRGRR